MPLTNDSTAASLVPLIDLKNIFAKQLPKMPKEYIVRLVLDRFHQSLACEFEREVVGGICYRVHPEQSFAEIAFCAVSASHQVALRLLPGPVHQARVPWPRQRLPPITRCKATARS